MRRSIFLIAGAAAVAGCGPIVSGSVPSARSRSSHTFEVATGGGPDGPAATPTPNPVDPASGLKIIGRVQARWSNDTFIMETVDPGGPSQRLPLPQDQFIAGLKKCGIASAAAITAASGFVATMWVTFGPRLTAAIGGAAFTELTLWEAVGVALATVSAEEIILAGIATMGMILDLYLGFVCFAAGATSG